MKNSNSFENIQTIARTIAIQVNVKLHGDSNKESQE